MDGLLRHCKGEIDILTFAAAILVGVLQGLRNIERHLRVLGCPHRPDILPS